LEPIVTDSPIEGHLLTPNDPHLTRRLQRLQDLGVERRPDEEFDAFARTLAYDARDLVSAPWPPHTMVNFVTDDQFFAGLNIGGAATSEPGVGRVMDRDHGYCPDVIDRGLPLVLDDVFDYPRYGGNPVVDEIGIRSYAGAPLIDEPTGTILGTICIVDTEPRSWGRPGLELITRRAEEFMTCLKQRETRRR
jgi:GAF domain-containing protein